MYMLSLIKSRAFKGEMRPFIFHDLLAHISQGAMNRRTVECMICA